MSYRVPELALCIGDIFPVPARSGSDPIEQQEAAHKIRKDAVERITDRMGAAVRGNENLHAEHDRYANEDEALPRHRPVEPAPPFEPDHVHRISFAKKVRR